MNLDMLSRRLRRHGYEVLAATNGEEAVSMALDARPDLIVMDLSLPRMNGWEAAGRIRAARETASIPIIALTAYAMTGEREKAIAAGCDEFETKPLDFGALLTKIGRLLNGRPQRGRGSG